MLRLESIAKSYGQNLILDQVSFSVEPGETLVLTGPSGSGKTTLLQIIAGLILPDEGRLYLRETLASQPGWGLPPHLRKIGFVFQTATLWPHMTVAQNILFGLHALAKSEARARLQTLLRLGDIERLEKRYPSQLSGGEARRVELLRAIAPGPDLLLMDEPLTNLDKKNKAHLLAAIQEITKIEKCCLLYVTHDQEETDFLAGRSLALEEGRLVS